MKPLVHIWSERKASSEQHFTSDRYSPKRDIVSFSRHIRRFRGVPGVFRSCRWSPVSGMRHIPLRTLSITVLLSAIALIGSHSAILDKEPVSAVSQFEFFVWVKVGLAGRFVEMFSEISFWKSYFNETTPKLSIIDSQLQDVPVLLPISLHRCAGVSSLRYRLRSTGGTEVALSDTSNPSRWSLDHRLHFRGIASSISHFHLVKSDQMCWWNRTFLCSLTLRVKWSDEDNDLLDVKRWGWLRQIPW